MILGILGGMGPAATCDFFNKIIQNTPASKDQDHIHVLIDSNSQIPDRTQYICGSGEDPRNEMIKSAIRLEMMGADYITIPCNTAHYFYNDVKQYTKANVLNMILETALYLKKMNSGKQEYLLLATEGVYAGGVYKKTFEDLGMKIIIPNDTDKKTVMSWIYNVKANNYDVSPKEFDTLVDKYITDRNTPIILGCTELPLLAEKIGLMRNLVDPVTILAKRCVEIAENDKHRSC